MRFSGFDAMDISFADGMRLVPPIQALIVTRSLLPGKQLGRKKSEIIPKRMISHFLVSSCCNQRFLPLLLFFMAW
jgi:hypothetical protein